MILPICTFDPFVRLTRNEIYSEYKKCKEKYITRVHSNDVFHAEPLYVLEMSM